MEQKIQFLSQTLVLLQKKFWKMYDFTFFSVFLYRRITHVPFLCKTSRTTIFRLSVMDPGIQFTPRRAATARKPVQAMATCFPGRWIIWLAAAATTTAADDAAGSMVNFDLAAEGSAARRPVTLRTKLNSSAANTALNSSTGARCRQAFSTDTRDWSTHWARWKRMRNTRDILNCIPLVDFCDVQFARSIDWLIGWLFLYCVNWSIDWLIGFLLAHCVGRLIDWLGNRFHYLSISSFWGRSSVDTEIYFFRCGKTCWRRTRDCCMWRWISCPTCKRKPRRPSSGRPRPWKIRRKCTASL